MNFRRRHATQNGFTLLELLVAIMILTLIMTAALGAVRVGSRSFESGVSRADETAEIRAVANVLRRQFRQILPVTWTENRQEFIAFEGDRQQVQFIGPAPDSSTGPGHLVYRLAAESSQHRSGVVLNYSPYDPGSDGFTMPEMRAKELLTERLSGVSFDYFGAPGEDDQPAWQSEWSAETGRMPVIVRMHFTSSGQPWPDLLFQVGFEQPE